MQSLAGLGGILGILKTNGKHDFDRNLEKYGLHVSCELPGWLSTSKLFPCSNFSKDRPNRHWLGISRNSLYMIVTIFNFHLRKSMLFIVNSLWHDSSFKKKLLQTERDSEKVYLAVSTTGKQTPFLQENHCFHSSVVICQVGWMGRTSLPCSLLPSLVWLLPAGSAAVLAGDALLLMAMIP